MIGFRVCCGFVLAGVFGCLLGVVGFCRGLAGLVCLLTCRSFGGILSFGFLCGVGII